MDILAELIFNTIIIGQEPSWIHLSIHEISNANSFQRLQIFNA